MQNVSKQLYIIKQRNSVEVVCCSPLHLHLSDAFIQSDLQLHSGYTFSLVSVFPGNRTHNRLLC